MAFPRNSLRAFLQHARTNLFKAVHEGHSINIVVGNESAGLRVPRPHIISEAMLTFIRLRLPDILASLRLHQIHLSPKR